MLNRESIVLAVDAILFQERLGLTKVILFLVALFGLILATGIQWSMIDSGSLLGVGFTLLGATFYALEVLVGKGLKSVKPEIVTFVQCAVGVLTVPMIDPAILHTSIELRQLGWLSALGILHIALVYALIYRALPKLKSSTIAILTFIYPVSAIFFDFVVNGRLVSPCSSLGSSSSLFRVSESHKDGSCRGFLLLGQSAGVPRWSRNSEDVGVPRKP
jgi:drug/metabolite transporter (DMT)-like permease